MAGRSAGKVGCDFAHNCIFNLVICNAAFKITRYKWDCCAIITGYSCKLWEKAVIVLRISR